MNNHAGTVPDQDLQCQGVSGLEHRRARDLSKLLMRRTACILTFIPKRTNMTMTKNQSTLKLLISQLDCLVVLEPSRAIGDSAVQQAVGQLPAHPHLAIRELLLVQAVEAQVVQYNFW